MAFSSFRLRLSFTTTDFQDGSVKVRHGGTIADEEIEYLQNPENVISSKLITYYY